MKKMMQWTVTIVWVAGFCFLGGCREETEQPTREIKLVSAKVTTAGGQEITKQADSKPAAMGQASEKTMPTVAGNPVVKMTTTMGVIEIELYPEKAPKTVANFLQYVDEDFYTGTIFHRVIKGFMIQGGGFTQNLQQKPTRPPIVNEAANGLKNQRGTIAMARTPVPDSATCQFFINHKYNNFLDYRGPSRDQIGYAVFGKVIKGMDIVDSIASVQTKQINRNMQNLPVQPIVITRVERVQ